MVGENLGIVSKQEAEGRGRFSDSVAMRFWPVERKSRSWGGGRQGVRYTV